MEGLVFRVCGHSKTEENFRKQKDGYFRCAECHRADQKKRRDTNPEAWRQRVRDSRRKSREKLVAPLMAEQKGLCAICGGFLKRFHLDHNHGCCPSKDSCSKCRRGLLCADCNVKLAGMEKPGWKEKAERYLEKWKARAV
jgi:hypothetical protein